MHLALSRFGGRRAPLQELAEEARDFGFDGVQAVPGELPEDLGAALDPAVFRILPHSLLEEPPAREAERAWDRARVASLVRTARDAQAEALVIEAGTLRTHGARARGERLLGALREDGGEGGAREAWEAIQAAADQAERELEALARALHAIRQAAPGLGLALAVEENPAALLTPSRLRLLREEAGLPGLGYWHDTGRAQARAALGLDQPGDWLDAHAAVALGCTLHDWAAGQDLRLPGEGCVDFRLVAEYLPRRAVRVLAAAPVYPGALLPSARDALAAAGLS